MALSDIQTLSNIFIYIHRYAMPILYAIGVIGNVSSALIFQKKSWRKNVCVLYFNICLFFNLCYINTSMLSSIFNTGFNINKQNSSVFVCKLYYYAAYIFSRLPPIILILATIDRLLISSENVDTRLYSSKRLAYFSVSISVVVVVIFHIHTLIKVDIFEIYPSVFVCYYETVGFYFKFVTISSLIINTIIFTTLIILSILAFKNVRRIRAVPRQQRQRVRAMNKKDFQLLRCLYVHDIIHVISSIFPSVLGVYMAANQDQTRTSLQTAIENFLSQSSVFTHHIPYFASFFIFISISKAFRQEIKRLGHKLCSRDLMVAGEDVNQEQNEDRNNVELNVVSTIDLSV